MTEKMDPEQVKAVMKLALKEWLDEKFATFGKWTAAALGAAIFSGIVYFVLWINGWHKP